MFSNNDQMKDSIITFLVESKIISSEDIAYAKEEALRKNVSIEDILLSEGKLNHEILRRAKAHVHGLSQIDLVGMKIPFEILSIIPEPISRIHTIVAYKKTGGNFEVALLDIESLKEIEFLKEKGDLDSKIKFIPRITDVVSIKHAILEYQKLLKKEFGQRLQKIGQKVEEKSEENESKSLEYLVEHALLQNASDIHLEPRGEKADEYIVRYRIAGRMHDVMFLPAKIISSILKNAQNTLILPYQNVSLKISTFLNRIAIRIFRQGSLGLTLEDVGFLDEELESIHKALHEKKGLLLVVGDNDEQKIKTLTTLLDIIKSPAFAIESLHNPKAHTLRNLLKQDLDVLMLSSLSMDIPDEEVLTIVFNALRAGNFIMTQVEEGEMLEKIREKANTLEIPLTIIEQK